MIRLGLQQRQIGGVRQRQLEFAETDLVQRHQLDFRSAPQQRGQTRLQAVRQSLVRRFDGVSLVGRQQVRFAEIVGDHFDVRPLFRRGRRGRFLQDGAVGDGFTQRIHLVLRQCFRHNSALLNQITHQIHIHYGAFHAAPNRGVDFVHDVAAQTDAGFRSF